MFDTLCLKCETSRALKMIENIKNTFAQDVKNIFHQQFEQRIAKNQNETNNTSFLHIQKLKMSGKPEQNDVAKGVRCFRKLTSRGITELSTRFYGFNLIF